MGELQQLIKGKSKTGYIIIDSEVFNKIVEEMKTEFPKKRRVWNPTFQGKIDHYSIIEIEKWVEKWLK